MDPLDLLNRHIPADLAAAAVGLHAVALTAQRQPVTLLSAFRLAYRFAREDLARTRRIKRAALRRAVAAARRTAPVPVEAVEAAERQLVAAVRADLDNLAADLELTRPAAARRARAILMAPYTTKSRSNDT